MATEDLIQSINNSKKKKGKSPLVSIGMPVYNGELFIREALTSLLEQTFTDFELIISDNASIDGTQVICSEFAVKDSRIRYVRQPENQGAIANFKFVLDESVGEYFMWAAADDKWLPTFVEENLNVLLNNSEIVCSVSQVSFLHEGKIIRQSSGTASITGPLSKRLYAFLKSPSDNSRFYGLHRRNVVVNSLSMKHNFHAADWYFVIITLLHGSYNCVDKVLMLRKTTNFDQYMRSIKNDNNGYLWFGIPLLPLTVQLARSLKISVFMNILPLLIRINLAHLKKYMRYKIRTFGAGVRR